LSNFEMLAPRKTLWSTPDAVIATAIEWTVPVTREGGKICDIGCGDGRVLLQWAEAFTSSHDISSCNLPSFVGIDIHDDHIQQAQKSLESAKNEGRIDRRISVTFHCQNALEALLLVRDATVLFLYLIPRGLRKLHPLLREQLVPGRALHVLTYMAPLPNETHLRRELISVAHQPGASWPLYLYRLETAPTAERDDGSS
jgi:SAM-dependent methyltransferase